MSYSLYTQKATANSIHFSLEIQLKVLRNCINQIQISVKFSSSFGICRLYWREQYVILMICNAAWMNEPTTVTRLILLRHNNIFSDDPIP